MPFITETMKRLNQEAILHKMTLKKLFYIPTKVNGYVTRNQIIHSTEGITIWPQYSAYGQKCQCSQD
jgi:hypothetical protein